MAFINANLLPKYKPLVQSQVIREGLESNLPIEVFYYGENEYDAQLVAALEVRFYSFLWSSS